MFIQTQQYNNVVCLVKFQIVVLLFLSLPGSDRAIQFHPACAGLKDRSSTIFVIARQRPGNPVSSGMRRTKGP
jgi:hypothetical protein